MTCMVNGDVVVFADGWRGERRCQAAVVQSTVQTRRSRPVAAASMKLARTGQWLYPGLMRTPARPLRQPADSNPARRVPLFAARAPREVHARLKRAATEDGLTIADELTRLLDLRQRVTEASLPSHPLARPVPVAAVVPSLHVVQQDSLTELNPVNWQPYPKPQVGHGIRATPPKPPV